MYCYCDPVPQTKKNLLATFDLTAIPQKQSQNVNKEQKHKGSRIVLCERVSMTYSNRYIYNT